MCTVETLECPRTVSQPRGARAAPTPKNTSRDSTRQRMIFEQGGFHGELGGGETIERESLNAAIWAIVSSWLMLFLAQSCAKGHAM